jgi:hypothetical protein
MDYECDNKIESPGIFCFTHSKSDKLIVNKFSTTWLIFTVSQQVNLLSDHPNGQMRGTVLSRDVGYRSQGFFGFMLFVR